MCVPSTARNYLRTELLYQRAAPLPSVQYLVSRGVSPQRLVAAGFGEFQPLDPDHTEEAYRRNRRIG